jgi:hypothetical protein
MKKAPTMEALVLFGGPERNKVIDTRIFNPKSNFIKRTISLFVFYKIEKRAGAQGASLRGAV